MPKYLVQSAIPGRFEGTGERGRFQKTEVIEQLVSIMGGKLEAYYFCYGEYDGIAIVDGRTW